MNRAWLATATVVLGAPAALHADPLPSEALSPRAVGRAGVGLVSNDSGLAALENPAGIARRGQARIALSLRLTDDSVSIDSTQLGTPRVLDKSGATARPALGYAHGIGDRWIVAAALTSRGVTRRYAIPQFGQLAEDVERLFPTRYGGLAAESTTRTIAVGAAFRATPWIALGISLGAESVSVETTRAIWAGFSGRDTIGDPRRDVLLTLRGSRSFIPRLSAGILAAPSNIPIEIAAATTLRGPTTLEGEARGQPISNVGTPPTVTAPTGAALDRPGVVVASAGLRYLGSRVAVELGASATLHWRRLAGENWRIQSLGVVDESGATGELRSVRALINTRPNVRVGGALDVAVIDGFLWLTGGYAVHSSPVSDRIRNPLLAAGVTHVAALGAEVVWSTFTISLGVSRGFSATRAVDDDTAVSLVNPFDSAAGTAPAATGNYGESSDRGALSVEYAF